MRRRQCCNPSLRSGKSRRWLSSKCLFDRVSGCSACRRRQKSLTSSIFTFTSVSMVNLGFELRSHFVPTQCDSALGQQKKSTLIQRIILVVYDLDDATVDNHFRAEQAWCKCGVERRAFQACAVIGGLRNGILFTVAAQTFIQGRPTCSHAVASGTSSFVAVFRPSRRPVVSR